MLPTPGCKQFPSNIDSMSDLNLFEVVHDSLGNRVVEYRHVWRAHSNAQTDYQNMKLTIAQTGFFFSLKLCWTWEN